MQSIKSRHSGMQKWVGSTLRQFIQRPVAKITFSSLSLNLPGTVQWATSRHGRNSTTDISCQPFPPQKKAWVLGRLLFLLFFFSCARHSGLGTRNAGSWGGVVGSALERLEMENSRINVPRQEERLER